MGKLGWFQNDLNFESRSPRTKLSQSASTRYVRGTSIEVWRYIVIVYCAIYANCRLRTAGSSPESVRKRWSKSTGGGTVGATPIFAPTEKINGCITLTRKLGKRRGVLLITGERDLTEKGRCVWGGGISESWKLAPIVQNWLCDLRWEAAVPYSNY